MDIKETLGKAICQATEAAMADGALTKAEVPWPALEVPPKKEMGDFATNFAMQSARVFHVAPRKIAEEVVKRLQGDWLDHVAIAGPGFINFYLKGDVISRQLQSMLDAGEHYGDLPAKDTGRILVEYVSANPTGLLHVGHGRGAAAGSALVNILRKAGYPVQSEYYINDAGKQMDNLGLSVNARYLELLGKPFVFPEEGYHGKDIIETAKRILDQDGEKYLAMEETERVHAFREIALKERLALLQSDLEKFHVTFDTWFSERQLHPEAVQACVEELKKRGVAYEKDGALWLRSTDYGDDKDRVIIRENGEPTYLAADIAYHKNKFDRGFARLINIWGADHHGYVCRVKASLQALGYDPKQLEILLLQMVSLYRGGELVKMSKRTGKSVTLEELIEEVGTDAARYFFIMRSLDSQLDFDLDLAKSQSTENPVYYIQYAHARIMSIFRQAQEAKLTLDGDLHLDTLRDPAEIDLIKKLASYGEEIERAAMELAPQRIARYVHDVAALFHGFYNRCRIVGAEDKEMAKARLALAQVTGHVIRHALAMLGISAPEKM